MTKRIRLPRLHLISAAALLAAVTLLTACGGEKQPTHHGHGEGAYVQAGPLIYQVQMSRQLEPANVEDREYLGGLPADEPPLRGDELWFGVWLRVQNATDEDHPAATQFTVKDTVGNEYHPIALADTNPFAYRATTISSEQGQPIYPDPESAAGSGPIQGAMLLFRLKTSAFDNRPVELEIVPADGGEPASVVLDL